VWCVGLSRSDKEERRGGVKGKDAEFELWTVGMVAERSNQTGLRMAEVVTNAVLSYQ
jgi:hypothetical protein